jgi:hypothetical protein
MPKLFPQLLVVLPVGTRPAGFPDLIAVCRQCLGEVRQERSRAYRPIDRGKMPLGSKCTER